MNKGPEIRAFRTTPRRGINVFIEMEKGDGFFIAEPLVWKKHEMFTADPPITTDLTPTAAQQLIDDLWDCGLRPSEGTGSAGAMAATQRHLEDMRTLVFKEKK